jgi:hypothetical protein
MSTTNNLTPKRNTKSSATRAIRARRGTPRSNTGTGLPALAPRTAKPAAGRAPAVDGRPHGHVVGHAFGEHPPVSLDGRPHGHVVGHAFGEQPPVSLEGRPHGHVVGHAFGEQPPVSLEGRPRGHVVGRGLSNSTTP